MPISGANGPASSGLRRRGRRYGTVIDVSLPAVPLKRTHPDLRFPHVRDFNSETLAAGRREYLARPAERASGSGPDILGSRFVL